MSYPQNFSYFHFTLGMINHSPIYLNGSPNKPQDQEKENENQGGDTENTFEESDSFFDTNDWTFYEFTDFETPQQQELETPQQQEIDTSQTQKLDNDHQHTSSPSDIQSSSLDNQNLENHNNFRQFNFQYPVPLLIQP